MKDQPWDLNQKFRAQKNIKFWITFSATSALDTAYLWNETKHGQTKMLVSIYNVSSVRWPLPVTFDPETADTTFGGHYVATIKLQHL